MVMVWYKFDAGNGEILRRADGFSEILTPQELKERDSEAYGEYCDFMALSGHLWYK